MKIDTTLLDVAFPTFALALTVSHYGEASGYVKVTPMDGGRASRDIIISRKALLEALGIEDKE